MPTVHKFKLNKAFTLIEVIMVVTIIALLLLLAVWTLRAKIDQANDAKRKADLQRIAVAFEEYYSDKDCYPTASILNTCGGGDLKNWGLSVIPCDPVYKTPYCYITDTDKPSCFQKFRVLNTLKYLSDPVIKLLGCDGNQYCGWEAECNTGGNATRFGFNYGITSPNITVLNPNMPQPTPTPLPHDNFYGCKNFVCVPILWNPTRPGPECDPNYQSSSCYGSCSVPSNQCVSWH